jgi:hypothetical protein
VKQVTIILTCDLTFYIKYYEIYDYKISKFKKKKILKCYDHMKILRYCISTDIHAVIISVAGSCLMFTPATQTTEAGPLLTYSK